jgi:hypothetical protein
MIQHTGTHVLDLELQDAYWQLPSGNYVPGGAVPRHPIEESDHLNASWAATVDSMKNEPVDPRVRAQVQKEFDAFYKRDTGAALPTPGNGA